MSPSLVDAESVLAIDLGTAHTRALLFDVVDGQYHYIAGTSALSTAGAPYDDVQEGVHQAIQHLAEITGRPLLNQEEQIILPSQSGGEGVDRLVITWSAGPELHLVITGLLADVSLESAQRLAASTYGRVSEIAGLSSRLSYEDQLDAILAVKPDVVILAGGAEGGASRSVLKMVELILMACRVLPADKRPQVVYAGNQALAKKVKEALEKWTPVHVTANIRPSIDQEDLSPARETLAKVATRACMNQLSGLARISATSSAMPAPNAYAFGRLIRFLGQMYDPAKGVLGVDVGARYTTLAAACGNDLTLEVYPYGVSYGAGEALKQSRLDDIARWLPMEIPGDVVRDALWQKTIYPNSLPMTAETLAIEQAFTRHLLRMAVGQTLTRNPQLNASFEPILASGMSLGRAPSPMQSLLMLLDGIQPVGITTLVLDQDGLVPALGAIAAFNSILPVQVFESGAFLNLGTVICPVCDARYGTPILNVRLEYESGNDSRLEVRQGNLVPLPIQPGQTARIHLNALRRMDIDPRGKRGSGSFKIVGGACGAVIDARGRPLVLPTNPEKRHELVSKWQIALGS